MSGVAELHRKLTALSTVHEDALRDAARAVETAAKDQGIVMVLGRRRRRVTLRAYSRFKGGGPYGAEVTVYGTPTGPWVWVNTGASGHVIPKRQRRKPRFLYAAGYPHPIGRQIHHPGRGGRGAWRKVVARAKVEVPKAFLERVRKAVT